MKDIIGRSLNDGDLVVGMARGRYSAGMHRGLIDGKSVVWDYKQYSFDSKPVKSSVENVYLLTNLTPEEQSVKDELVGIINENKALSNTKAIPKKDLIVGGIYLNKKKEKCLYLGTGRFITHAMQYANGCNSPITQHEDGFMSVYRIKEPFSEWQEQYTVTIVTKTFPKFIKLIDTINIPSGIITIDRDTYKKEYVLEDI